MPATKAIRPSATTSKLHVTLKRIRSHPLRPVLHPQVVAVVVVAAQRLLQPQRPRQPQPVADSTIINERLAAAFNRKRRQGVHVNLQNYQA